MKSLITCDFGPDLKFLDLFEKQICDLYKLVESSRMTNRELQKLKEKLDEFELFTETCKSKIYGGEYPKILSFIKKVRNFSFVFLTYI